MHYLRFNFLLLGLISLCFGAFAQSSERWQQEVKYDMEIDFDVAKHQFKGKQTIKYTNNSPDEINRVFYHLYFNAFQPGSMMDIRNKNLPDSDSRVKDRIGNLSEEEIGYQRILTFMQDGKPCKMEHSGTILEVDLAKALMPGKSTTLEMTFDSQVPVQIRRSGRDNREGISYSMTQWYPKLCEYDYQGWHANPYVGREFHGVWGDFDVKISIDENYTIGGTGYLQDAASIGHGYEGVMEKKKSKNGKHTWHFKAPNVHDFAWAADTDYKHTRLVRKDGVVLHFIYVESEATKENWEKLPKIIDVALDRINEQFGVYPYKQYTFIQGGDGGMEYPMATLITGERSLGSLVGVSVHELFHSWYQMILGTNESLYPWMDEGFTSYGTNATMAWLRSEGLLGGEKVMVKNPQERSYSGYFNLVASGLEEPMTTHSDHYNTNFAYGQAAYSKGAVYLNQISYIVGKENFEKGMLAYYDEWKFRHPNPNDFIRIMEKQSGLELDWYNEYFVNSTKTIDYGVVGLEKGPKKTSTLTLNKIGAMPMPIDLVITDKKGKEHYYTIPLRIMRGAKSQDGDKTMTVLEDWPWTNPSYEVSIPFKMKKVAKIEIDPSKKLADVNGENNVLELGDKID